MMNQSNGLNGDLKSEQKIRKSRTMIGLAKDSHHYENTSIQIYWKFYHKDKQIFR